MRAAHQHASSACARCHRWRRPFRTLATNNIDCPVCHPSMFDAERNGDVAVEPEVSRLAAAEVGDDFASVGRGRAEPAPLALATRPYFLVVERRDAEVGGSY